jgi:hypothetical protein
MVSINIAIAPDAIRALMERDPSSYGSIGCCFGSPMVPFCCGHIGVSAYFASRKASTE